MGLYIQGVLVQLPVCLNVGKLFQLLLLEIPLRNNVKGKKFVSPDRCFRKILPTSFPLTLVHSTLLDRRRHNWTLSLWGWLQPGKECCKTPCVAQLNPVRQLRCKSILGGKVDNFPTREGIIQELLVICYHLLVYLQVDTVQRLQASLQRIRCPLVPSPPGGRRRSPMPGFLPCFKQSVHSKQLWSPCKDLIWKEWAWERERESYKVR